MKVDTSRIEYTVHKSFSLSRHYWYDVTAQHPDTNLVGTASNPDLDVARRFARKELVTLMIHAMA